MAIINQAPKYICDFCNSETTYDKFYTPSEFDARVDGILKTAKALHTFPGFKKPKNLQYVTTLEEDRAAIRAAVREIVPKKKPYTEQVSLEISEWSEYNSGFNDAIDKILEAIAAPHAPNERKES